MVSDYNKDKDASTKIEVNIEQIVQYSLMNVVLIWISLRKTMFLMTVFKSFGTMIRLVEKTVMAIIEFFVFFVMMILVSSILIKVVGYDIGEINLELDAKTGEIKEVFESKSDSIL